MENNIVETVVIKDAEYEIVRLTSNNKNAVAKLRGNQIQISIPSRWPNSEKERIFENLKKRSIRAIEKERWKGIPAKDMEFDSGQIISVLGQNYSLEILTKDSGNVKASVIQEKIEIVIPEKQIEIKNEIVKRTVMKFFREKLKERIDNINNQYFHSILGETSIREASSRWGSCSSNNDIMISLRLLFMPLDIIDYVIVHELAHTKYRGHGVRFWQCVEKVMPEYKEKKEWLKKNGNSYPKLENKIEQKTIDDFCDEPY